MQSPICPVMRYCAPRWCKIVVEGNFCQLLSGLRRFPLVSGCDSDALRVRSSISSWARSCDIGRSLVRIAFNRALLSVSAVNSTWSPGCAPIARRAAAGIVTWPFFVNLVIVETLHMARLKYALQYLKLPANLFV